MIYDLSKNNPYDRQKFIDRVNELLEKGCAVSLTKKAPQRSIQQNKYLHVLISYFASEYGISAEECKQDCFKRAVNPEIFIRVKTNKYGRQVSFLRSTADLDSNEMTMAIDRFRNWSASVAGIYLPDANESQFLLHCEKVIEANQEYL